MARRSRINPFDDFPGLFDEVGAVGEPQVRLSGGAVHGLGRHSDMPLGPIVVAPVPNKIVFISFGSGSSGNCAYIGDGKSGFLIDAGVEPKQVVDALASYRISMDSVKGIFITHDHGDHMRYAYTLLRKYRHMRLMSTPRALNGMLRRHNVSRRLKDYHQPIFKEIPVEVDNFTVTAFEVVHDGTDNVGFFIEHDSRAFAIATDLGCISERADYYMRRADYLVIESNYDLDMLIRGPYPEYLKARIRNSNGHLDNKVTAAYLADIYTERLKYVWLCHLSNDNNTPEKAIAESRAALEARGVTVGDGRGATSAQIELVALPRLECTTLFTLRAKI